GVSAASTAATTAYAQHRGPDVAHAAKEMSPDWMKQVSGFVKQYLDEFFSGRSSGTDTEGYPGDK
ncbi:hypothetical protein G6M89_22075, partial [Natronolimnobius sp. AArcel1]|uniref:hypothetical protein n=1 Tax=Natronolimnobius sp. AArcel1 TaxID=1679093 RepID=UPI0013ECFA85